MATDEGKRSKRSADKMADAPPPSGGGARPRPSPGRSPPPDPGLKVELRAGMRHEYIPRSDDDQDAVEEEISAPAASTPNDVKDFGMQDGDRSAAAAVSMSPSPPSPSPATTDMNSLGETTEPSMDVKTTDVRTAVIRNRQLILQDAPAVQKTIRDVLDHFEINKPNDEDTIKLVTLVKDLSGKIDEFVVLLETSHDELADNKATADLFQKIVAVADTFEQNTLLTGTARLLLGVALLGFASLFSPLMSPYFTTVILTGIAFPGQAGKISKLFKNAADLLRGLGGQEK